MNEEVTGILDVDYPELTDDEHRAIQTEDPDTVVLPDGSTVSEYAAKIEDLKARARAQAESLFAKAKEAVSEIKEEIENYSEGNQENESQDAPPRFVEVEGTNSQDPGASVS